MHGRFEIRGVGRVKPYPLAVIIITVIGQVVRAVLPQFLRIQVADIPLHHSFIEIGRAGVGREIIAPVRTTPLESHVLLRIIDIRLRCHNHIARGNDLRLQGGEGERKGGAR